MSLQAGTRLGQCEIQSALGAGGMGEVYQDRVARFQREAQILAALDHPNIAAIYGLEESPSTGSEQAAQFLVLELVRGGTLAQRVADVGRALSGPPKTPDPIGSGLHLDEAPAIIRQVADALQAAHEKGIIHRPEAGQCRLHRGESGQGPGLRLVVRYLRFAE